MIENLVSVIIPNYNYAHYLREAIGSVLKQTYPETEIIVVDDGSNDASRAVLASYGDRVRAIFQENQGVSAARNTGVAAGSGEFVAFLDADDSWLPTKIEKQVSRFRNDPDLGLVHVAVNEVDASGNPLLERFEGLEGSVAGELLMLKRAGILGGGSGLMVTRRVFDEVGGFDTRLSTSADWDFFYQVSSRYRVGFVPELLLSYRVHNTNMHANVAAMERDMTVAFEKAFASASPEISRLRRRAYGVLNRTLAASYFRAGKYADFVRTAAKAVAAYPPILLGTAK
jgi:glycosyltransferase involved in cell wall biosynthesis